jgi:hypothetical protein
MLKQDGSAQRGRVQVLVVREKGGPVDVLRVARRVEYAVIAAAVAGKLAGVGAFNPYPTLSVAAGAGELGLAALVAVAGALPFAGAGARLGVAGG